MRRGLVRVLRDALLIAVAASGPVAAQDVRTDEPRTGPVVGLALSGGAARGLAHIGVIQALSELGVPVHVVAGTSMGALIGGLYATGISPDSLEAVARSFNEMDVFDDQVPRNFLSPDRRLFDERILLTLPIRDGGVQLPGGALEGGNVLRALERATWRTQAIRSFDELPRSFAAVATDLRSGDAVVLTEGGLAEAIRASVAIPGLFQPVERDGRLLVDGALVRNLPARDARALGADVLICSDVSRPVAAREYDSLVDVLSTAISMESTRHLAEEYDLCDVVLRPLSEELTASDFDALDTWVALGRTTTRAASEEIAAVLDRAGGAGGLAARDARRRSRVSATLPDSVVLGGIRFSGVDVEREEPTARSALGLRVGEWVDADEVNEAMTSLQATDLYDRISYALVPAEMEAGAAPPGSWILDVELRPVQRDRLGLGVRFDNQYQASVLLSATLLNRWGYGSTTRLDARLGEELSIEVSHSRGRGVTSAFGLGVGVGFNRIPLTLAEAGERLQEVRANQLYGALRLSLSERRGGLLAAELRGERVTEETVVGSGVATRDRTFATLRVVGLRDALDRADFPTRGLLLEGMAEWADRSLGSNADFTRYLGELQAVFPLGGRVSLQTGLFAGAASGPDLPLNRHFFLGGVNTSQVLRRTHPRLWGFSPQDRWGQVAQAAHAALQVEVATGWFLTGRANAGQVRDDWDVDFGAWVGGWGVGFGTSTVLGPAEVALVGRDTFGDLRFTLTLGRAF